MPLADKYLTDVKKALKRVRDDPSRYAEGMTQVYGMAANLPERSVVTDLLVQFMDRLYFK